MTSSEAVTPPQSRSTAPGTYDVLIIGAGISGIGASIKLIESGNRDFVVLEKASDLGGTWRDNTYPGCECDVPSALYSFSFAQNPSWSRTFAGQAEILSYVRHTAEHYGVLPFIRFEAPVEHSRWLEERCQWEVKTAEGIYYANKLISCVGYLHEPIIPDLPGLREFTGVWFHSSRWNHETDLTGKRVAVIGTGASAIQFVPEIQPLTRELVLYQRTPQWVLPKPNRTTAELEKRMYQWPFTLNGVRQTLYSAFELLGVGFRYPAILKQAQRIAKAHIGYYIKDETLRRKLTPDYTMGCKRVLMSNDYYPALAKRNVDVLATGVKEIRGNLVVGSDGSEREVDVIILATGFHVTDVPIAAQVTGADGQTLAEKWQGSPEAYKGTTVSGFPNFFLMLGPNLGIGHNSAYIVIESQIQYIMDTLKNMRRQNITRLDVRPEVQSRYNAIVQKELQTTVWNTGGCSSYYLDASGKNAVGFPWHTMKMRSLLSRWDKHAYTFQLRGN